MVEALQLGSTLQIGSSLQYHIESVLGRGGFGITYLATDLNLDTQVAIKEYLPGEFAERTSNSQVIPKTGADGELYQWGLDRFIEEARTLAKFKHPNIVRVLNVFKKNNTAYMIMEYEAGSNLQEMFKVAGYRSEERLVSIFDAILSGLEHVHAANIVHRDIKPANIYIRSDNTPVLLDFGSAREHLSGKTQAMTRILTKGYAPYEQEVEGGGRQGPWTDIYAMGVTLYYAISCEIPTNSVSRFSRVIQKQSDPLTSAKDLSCASGYSTGFLSAIDQALQILPDERPQSAAAFRKLLSSKHSQEAPSSPEPEKNDLSQDKTVLADEALFNQPLAQSQPQGLLQQEPQASIDTGRPFGSKFVLTVVLLSVLGIGVGAAYYFNAKTTSSAVKHLVIDTPENEPIAAIEKAVPIEASIAVAPANDEKSTTEIYNQQMRELESIEAENKRQLALAQKEYQELEDSLAAKAIEEATRAEETAIAEEAARAAEQAAIAKQAALAAEQAAIAEQAARVAEQTAIAEEAARAEQAAIAEEAARAAEQAAIAEKAARTAEQAAIAEEAVRAAKLAAIAEEAARAKQAAIAEEAAQAAEQAAIAEEAARAAEQKALAEEAERAQQAALAEQKVLDAAKAKKAAQAKEARRIALAKKQTKASKKKTKTAEQAQQESENDMQTISRLFNNFRVYLSSCDIKNIASSTRGTKDNLAFVKQLCQQYNSMDLGIKNLRGNAISGVGSANLEIKLLQNPSGDHIYPSKSWSTLQLKTKKVDGYWNKVEW